MWFGIHSRHNKKNCLWQLYIYTYFCNIHIHNILTLYQERNFFIFVKCFWCLCFQVVLIFFLLYTQDNFNIFFAFWSNILFLLQLYKFLRFINFLHQRKSHREREIEREEKKILEQRAQSSEKAEITNKKNPSKNLFRNEEASSHRRSTMREETWSKYSRYIYIYIINYCFSTSS